jgi:regulator of protease activity HflC (stomatin/prohibitin superfamily)
MAGFAVFLLIALIVILGILSLMGYGFWTVVGAGQVGVQDTFGKVDPNVLGSGLHLKAPWTNIIKFDVRTQAIDMTGVNDAKALTSEGLTIEMSATTLYHVAPDMSTDIYKTLGIDYTETIIVPEVRGALREEVAKYRAEDIYSQERGGIARAVEDNLNAKLNPRGIYIDDVIIRNVILPEQLSQAIQAKQTAEQQIQQKLFEVDREKAEAERKRQEAQGIADANRIIAGSLSENYLRWYWIEKIAAGGNTIYVPSDMSLVKTI